MDQSKLRNMIETRWFEYGIIALIVLNAITLGLETVFGQGTPERELLIAIDRGFVFVFTLELALKFVAYRASFWRSGWNVFDLVVVGIALVPAAGPFAVLRALRILRVLRLISVIPALRRVVDGFMHALGGLVSVLGVLAIIFYVGAVMSTKLFGASFPEFFGTIGASAYSLFQIMTLESWSMGIVRPVMEVYPYAWAFFIPFILVTTFAVLNLLIGIIVNSMQSIYEREQRQLAQRICRNREIEERISMKLDELERTVAELRAELGRSASS